ncbi:DNA gyrase inhibitor YacG [Endozoicomonas sp. Mp262]|uniref:DNA gyrase inhibitor YacG n=1 Tax=Endozoicomonas sp. Mp262 TaxID=2919499 RepID=UPI0021DAC531
MTTKVKCPHCGKAIEWKPENRFRPFCSERCKLIDFGAWAKEEHVIAGNPEFDDYMSDSSDEFKPNGS